MVSAGAALGRRVSTSSRAAAAAAAAATPRPQRHQQTRRCHSSSAPSTSKATVHLSASSTTVSEWPSFLKPRLAELRTNIIDQLAGRDRIPAFMRMRQAAIDAGDGAAAAAPTMEQMARLYFERGGKLFRPRIAMLMASACNQEVLARGSRLSASSSAPHADPAFDAYDDISGQQAAIALIAEMIHVASLVHDDVIDECALQAATRRGAPSVNGYWGNKMAVLAGDFILARATQALCQIGDPRVISTMAKIIEDLVVGEFLQMSPELSPAGGEDQRSEIRDQRSTSSSSSSLDDRLSLYLQKSERKTASLFENACRSVAMLASASDGGLHGTAAAYGRHVGLAFQLVDDAIDYEAEEEDDSAAAGKPIAVDLEQGLITGPLLLAVSSEAELVRLLRASPAQIRETVRRSGACERTRELATTRARRAAEIATSLRCRNGASEALAGLALKQLERRV
ncbi:coq-1 [Pristionchus pacificus]|nr:coq-1 [Pristionchus pacificus]|eukprot:PDM68759.1 coq-1 [Pristionchus pacificus]